MIYKDPVHKVLKLLESENINPGNLLIGQSVQVKVTDARKAEFLRTMTVGEFYPDGSVLLKDNATQEAIVLQFQWDVGGRDGLVYTGQSDFGVTYELVINANLMSNQSITSLNESRKKINEAVLKPFKKEDFYLYGGVDSISPDGEPPFIASSELGDVIVSTSDGGENPTIGVYFDDDDAYYKEFKSIEAARSEAKKYVKALDFDSVDKSKKYLESAGFKLVMGRQY